MWVNGKNDLCGGPPIYGGSSEARKFLAICPQVKNVRAKRARRFLQLLVGKRKKSLTKTRSTPLFAVVRISLRFVPPRIQFFLQDIFLYLCLWQGCTLWAPPHENFFFKKSQVHEFAPHEKFSSTFILAPSPRDSPPREIFINFFEGRKSTRLPPTRNFHQPPTRFFP